MSPGAATAPATGPILLVHPMADAGPFWDFLHFQLAHLSYPRRIDLVAAYVSGDYVAILAPPGVPLGPGWEPRRAGAALILYGPAVP